MWVGAEIAKYGSARITEVIDASTPGTARTGTSPACPSSNRRPGSAPPWTPPRCRTDSPITDDWDSGAHRIRVGDPGHTVGGIHRYRIPYTLPEVVRGGKLAWDAVGTAWKVDLDHVEIHLAAPFGLTGTRCVQGTTVPGGSAPPRSSARAVPASRSAGSGQVTAPRCTPAPGAGWTARQPPVPGAFRGGRGRNGRQLVGARTAGRGSRPVHGARCRAAAALRRARADRGRRRGEARGRRAARGLPHTRVQPSGGTGSGPGRHPGDGRARRRAAVTPPAHRAPQRTSRDHFCHSAHDRPERLRNHSRQTRGTHRGTAPAEIPRPRAGLV
ncbi:DUF2207 domain-containing protein [Streptomyces malaysiense]|uniref:DUF2207 domain-containing protein n=1 Tax=Streptomyces malaysiense TaxID=1428626 RepID=UPI003B847C3C